ALTTIGTARMENGTGRGPLERALELALAANSPDAAVILIDLAVEAAFSGDVPREDELFAEAYATAERFGDIDGARFAVGDRIWTRWALGHWDEAVEMADEFIAQCESSPHYLECSAREIRASMRSARGDLAGALADTERSLELGRKAGDPQAVVPALATACSIYVALGRLGDARALAREVVELSRANLRSAGVLIVLTPEAALLGVEAEVRELVERAPGISFVRAARAAAAGDHSGAADLLAGFGAPTFEARHRLAAAESLLASGRRADGEVELRRALEFYR